MVCKAVRVIDLALDFPELSQYAADLLLTAIHTIIEDLSKS